MTQKSYYVDTNIWLNLFKMEGDPSKGKPYWKIAFDFFERVKQKDEVIYVSSIILKELKYKLDAKFDYVTEFFRKSKFIRMIKTKNEDYDFARKLEEETNFKISFLDYLHIAISKRLDVLLITRDRDMIEIAKNYIKVKRPEELVN